LQINELYKNALNGDKDAEKEFFEELSVRFSLFAFQRIRNEEDAEEIVQDTMLTIIDNYRAIKFDVSFSAWAYNVLINRIRNYYRKNKVVKGVIKENFGDVDKYSDQSTSPILIRKLLNCLREILGINKRYARVLNLKFQGYDADFISKKLKISTDNLYVLVYRARSMLQACLDRGESK
jgi:RNA polymerase sigma-70 factor (ECF subfamily)